MAPGTNSHCLVTSHAFRYVHKGPGYFWNECIVSQTWSARDVGPNITGRFGQIQTRYVNTAVIEGAFYKDSPTNNSFSGGSNWEITYLGIDASRSSSMYGAATSVQPLSLFLLPCIKF